MAEKKVTAKKETEKKTAPKAAAKTAAKAVKDTAKTVAKKAEAKVATAKKAAPAKTAAKQPKVIIQSPMGGDITPAEILKKVGKVDEVYVRVDENKAYWVKGDKSGSVDLW